MEDLYFWWPWIGWLLTNIAWMGFPGLFAIFFDKLIWNREQIEPIIGPEAYRRITFGEE